MGLTCYWVTPGYQVTVATCVYDMFLYGLWLKSYLLGWCFQCLSRAFLKVSTSLAFTNFSGSSFHIVAIRSVKKYLRRFSLLPLLKIFLLWPLSWMCPWEMLGLLPRRMFQIVSWKSLSCLRGVVGMWESVVPAAVTFLHIRAGWNRSKPCLFTFVRDLTNWTL